MADLVEIFQKRREAQEIVYKNRFEKGGFPIGTIRNGYEKIADTGGSGDWKKLDAGDPKHLKDTGKKQESKPQSTSGNVSDEQIAEYEKRIPKPSVDQTWKAYETFANMVCTGITKSLVAFGTGGVGKTFTMKKVLENNGMVEFDESIHDINNPDEYDYVKITGAGSGSSVYQALFEHQDKLIIFDDCDSVLRDQNAVNFFKGALDSTGDGTISYKASTPIRTKREDGADVTATGITTVPDRFKFKGSVVFISNLPPEDIPQPLIDSRCLSVDLSMTKDETMERLDKILPKMDILDSKGNSLNASEEDKRAAYDFLNEHKDNMRIGKLNARTLGNIIKIVQAHHRMGESGEEWKDTALTLLYN